MFKDFADGGPGYDLVLLEGSRRSGKSSILSQLQSRAAELLPGWLVVYCSFQSATGHDKSIGITTPEIFRHIAVRIGHELASAGHRTWFADQPAPVEGKPFHSQFSKAATRAFATAASFRGFRELYTGRDEHCAAPAGAASA